jgi:hypothetical protein
VKGSACGLLTAGEVRMEGPPTRYQASQCVT